MPPFDTAGFQVQVQGQAGAGEGLAESGELVVQGFAAGDTGQ
jgi:hypothetical protein